MEAARREEEKAETEAKARAKDEAELELKKCQEQRDLEFAKELQESREDVATLETEQGSNPLLLPR